MPTITITSKFYEFRQNNSGGSFDIGNGLGRVVWIEALSADDANNRAEAVGIYFDGCEKQRDCECCGDRWYRASEHDGVDALPDDAEYVHRIKIN